MTLSWVRVVCAASVLWLAIPHASGGESLLINGEIDEWKDGKPVGWNVLEGMVATRDTAMRVGGTASARMHPTRDQVAAHNNVILEQYVDLEPNTAYELTFWAAKDDAGDVRAYVVAEGGGGIVLEYISGWADFFVWTPITCTFQTNDATRYAVRLVQYGYPNHPVWFDRATLKKNIPGEAKGDAVTEQVSFFSQSTLIPFDEAAPDDTAVRTRRFTLQKAENEYESTLVAFQAGADLAAVDLRLAGPLVSETGQKIAADRVEIRANKDGVLPLTRPRDVAAGQSAAWWVTVKPTPGLPVGIYHGRVELVAGGKAIGHAELVVEQLDLTLPETDTSFFTWHTNYYFDSEFLTPELMKAYYRDMAEHGMTTVTIYNTPTPDGQTIDLSRNHMLSAAKYPEFAEWGYDDVVPEILEAGLNVQGQPLLLLSAAQEGPIAGKKSYGETVVKDFLSAWSERKWPKPYLYVDDEPSTQDRIDAVKPVLERIKSWSYPVSTTTAGLDIPQLGHLYDLWIMVESEINREHLDAARDKDATLWTYNCTVPHTNAPFNRAFYGFWAYRTGLKGFGRWAYYDNNSAYVGSEGEIHGTSGTRLNFVFASADGPVPTVGWEAARDGTEDYRLMALFDQTHAEAKARLAELEGRYEGVLSAEDRQTLGEIFDRQFKRKADDEAPLAWEAASAEQTQAKEAFQDASELRRLLLMTKYARTKAFESIPADAMAHRGALPFSKYNETLYPPLGIGDQRTVTEVKRMIILSYLMRLREALDAADGR